MISGIPMDDLVGLADLDVFGDLEDLAALDVLGDSADLRGNSNFQRNTY